MTKLAWVAAVIGLVGAGVRSASAQEAADPPAEEAEPESEPKPEPEPEQEPEPEPPKPWAAGVTAEQKTRAEALVGEGNKLFVASQHREALEKYKAALAQYDHPKIRFNITRALINLDRPLEALEHIEAALEYGRPGLDNFYGDAQTYRASLENQVATLEVSCSQTGVSVTVDGQPFLSCPGKKSVRVLPGRHQVVGKKPGFITSTEDLTAAAGAANPVEVKLVTFDEVAVTVRRWERWKPWAVLGGGVVVGSVGVLLELQARSTRDEYSDLLADNCSDEPCEADFGRSIFNRARLEHGIALSAMIVGGAAVVTGVAAVILNRPRKQIPEDADQPRGPQVVPAVSANSAGISISGQF